MMKHTLFSLSILVLCNSCGDRKEEANIRDLSVSSQKLAID